VHRCATILKNAFQQRPRTCRSNQRCHTCHVQSSSPPTPFHAQASLTSTTGCSPLQRGGRDAFCCQSGNTGGVGCCACLHFSTYLSCVAHNFFHRTRRATGVLPVAYILYSCKQCRECRDILSWPFFLSPSRVLFFILHLTRAALLMQQIPKCIPLSTFPSAVFCQNRRNQLCSAMNPSRPKPFHCSVMKTLHCSVMKPFPIGHSRCQLLCGRISRLVTQRCSVRSAMLSLSALAARVV